MSESGWGLGMEAERVTDTKDLLLSLGFAAE